MDYINISDLAVQYCVGVPDAERAQPQRLLLTVAMATDFSAAARMDDVRRTIDYATVTQQLLSYGQGRSWQLIETLAIELAELLLDEYQPFSVTVEVKKFVIPEAAYVSVRTTRPAK